MATYLKVFVVEHFCDTHAKWRLHTTTIYWFGILELLETVPAVLDCVGPSLTLILSMMLNMFRNLSFGGGFCTPVENDENCEKWN